MNLSHYLKLIKSLYKEQRKSVEKRKRCIGYNGGTYVYESVEDYDSYIKEFINNQIEKGSLVKDMEEDPLLYLQKEESDIVLNV